MKPEMMMMVMAPVLTVIEQTCSSRSLPTKLLGGTCVVVPFLIEV